MVRTAAGRGDWVSGRRSRGRLLALITVAASVALAPAAQGAGGGPGSSGGAGASPPPNSGSPSPGSPAPAPRGPDPLAGRGMWIWELSLADGGDVSQIIATAHQYGVSTLMIKSGDGSSMWTQFNSQLVAQLHANGLRVCAWQYVYGRHPIYEAEVGAAAVHDGANCLLIDAESEYQGRYVQAQQYIEKLRQLIGASFPVGLAGFPYVDFHPSFPYSVFLGPGGAQYNVPQMYWADIGTSVDDVYTHTYQFNAPYGRPIEPLGEVTGAPPTGQILRFRQMSRAYDAAGVSWWDWQGATARTWQALARRVGNLAHFSADPATPTLSVKGQGGIWQGDLVVWAQEHLFSAGERVAIDGGFGAQTETAVEDFQAAHSLPVTGIVDALTWQALLHYQPAKVTWVSRRGKSTASASTAAGSLRLRPPSSATLAAERYEIPPHLGAGRP